MDSVVALVPMKEHSARVPDKNFREFDGKPLFYWILHELSKVERVKGIFVNTDSKRLADSIKDYFGTDVSIIDRPPELCGDEVPMNAILGYDIGVIGSEHYLQTHSTNPLLTSCTIGNSIDRYFNDLGTYDSVFSVTRIQNRGFTHDGRAINHNPDELIPTQDLHPIYLENSNIYIFSKTSFGKKMRRIGEKPFLFEMNQYEAIDIDEEEDFAAAEALHKVRFR
jgi:CMP-N-acetylneuraminic acid synthetase